MSMELLVEQFGGALLVLLAGSTIVTWFFMLADYVTAF